MSSSLDKRWRFCQVFGDQQAVPSQLGDVISAVEYDLSGEFFATGDYAGRIVLFSHTLDPVGLTTKHKLVYDFEAELQSHNPDFGFTKFCFFEVFI
jgi:serine/threonine-protein phosphatase 2A regulatory subunit B